VHISKTKGNIIKGVFVKRRRSQKTQGSFGRHTGLSSIKKIVNKQMISFFRRMTLFLPTKKQVHVAELFNEHFVHIADGVGEISGHNYGRVLTTTQALRLFKRTLVQKAKKIVSAFYSQTPRK